MYIMFFNNANKFLAIFKYFYWITVKLQIQISGFWITWKGIPLLNGISDPPSLDYLPLPVLIFIVLNAFHVPLACIVDSILLECTQTEVSPAERGSVFAATNLLCCIYLVVYGIINLLLPNPNLIYLSLICSVLIADLYILVLAFRVKKQMELKNITALTFEDESLMENQSDSD